MEQLSLWVEPEKQEQPKPKPRTRTPLPVVQPAKVSKVPTPQERKQQLETQIRPWLRAFAEDRKYPRVTFPLNSGHLAIIRSGSESWEGFLSNGDYSDSLSVYRHLSHMGGEHAATNAMG